MANFLEMIFFYISAHTASAHLIICALILLAGLYLPISEDFLILTAGIVASKTTMIEALQMYVIVFVACIIAGWEAYWIGRWLGPKLLRTRWFTRLLPERRVQKMKEVLHRHGFLTFIIGRFIPGGARNALFLSSGLIKMPFSIFAFRDFCGCLLVSSILFYLGFLFGANSQTVFHYLHVYERFLLLTIAFGIVSSYAWWRIRRCKFLDTAVSK